MPSGRPKPRAVCTWALRAWFNEYGVVRRVAAGQIIASIIVDEPHAKPPAGLPPGTRRQIVRYSDKRSGRLICLAHQTVCQHGMILRSGFPDPKSRYSANEVQHALTNHPDDESYTCGETCARDRRRTEEARAKIEQYRQSCHICVP